MRKQDIYTKPWVIFAIFIIVSLVNILSSVYFISIMLAGVVFILFDKLLEKRQYNLLFFIILTFLVIENIQGFSVFSLFLISLFISIFIKSSVIHIFSSTDLTKSLYIFIFYICLVFVYGVFHTLNIVGLSTIAINIVVDIIIVGLFI